jgi:Mrp family chromosome partitioning ATPase
VLALWRQGFDYVVIDSSPVFAADDAMTLAPKVDGTLFVVRSRSSRASEVRQALDLLSQRQAKVLGLVYNRADSSALSYKCYKGGNYVQFGANVL